ncbi:porphobilinogen synthase [Ornithobacterium rhinotracheale]|uniref:Delta-aminolevulinic acid dehydratase n=1 Tax=Ornithobacterium rhinotracheale (strain ATCC 51463 / DSM 15997 / CCUG 23171 / CIP 104009 / LMG 9086) TaxID=867902 RepID=I3ZZF8_ORNRL|nr:porphobilinogen synthase [Ornithobacterium rhinotracheale]AFL97092.1 delta-aminolevulinic acid dehydratase [Ornithobacterium rhinotracheale DSM 15997]AIP99203.1 delta-aminolevulinic acid dehydratase [Ornithobacterium rhinotracheale ORT-UMN 88]KGB67071.1 delta-aminolevulinic acid dehydratase [Ornithobacterium rhinotracheale H06-030791]MBN3662294.1 porphobilinogen synthase [Ornithobacterium rhinotracheale]MCK0194389.1 porphobilinogen synthase [Ornithobacterium rhinotracheale]
MYPYQRNRRTRSNEAIRNIVRETSLSTHDLMLPLFIMEGENLREEIPSMPGVYRITLDVLEKEIQEIWDLGIQAVNIYCKVPDELKDNEGTEALNPNGLMQRAIKTIKKAQKDMLVFTDVALDPVSSYGHDGIVENGEILNDETVEILAKMALSHAEAGADFIAPSDMMDGRVLAIREILEQNGFHNVGIMSYTAKYASSFYGPFRDALDSAPGFGDKKTYQMDYANVQEAYREADNDLIEGADILMVKPGMPYLDVLYRMKEYTKMPIAVYQVSGEYAMLKAAAEKGWLDFEKCLMESMYAFKRAGADLINTYYAKEVATILNRK